MTLEEISSLVSEIPEHYVRPDCPELGDVELLPSDQCNPGLLL